MEYLVTGTAILTDAIFNQYGGNIDNVTAAQRNAAYMIAEQQAIREIHTFLVPTTVTGTFEWPVSGDRLQLPFNRVKSINSVTAMYELACNCQSVNLSGCAWLIDGDNGVIDLRRCGSGASCACAMTQGVYTWPKFAQISFTAGIAAGMVAANSSALLGLVTGADIVLDQILAAVPDGDPMIEIFSDTGLFQNIGGLKVTAFGGSWRANYAANLLRPLKFKGSPRMR